MVLQLVIKKFLKKNFYEFFEFNRFKKLSLNKKKIIFYSENESQWDFFSSTIKYLCENHNCNICYITSSKNEIKINRNIRNLHKFYIGSSFIRTIFFRVLNTRLLIMSLPDLNKYEIKRSNYSVKYIFIPHNILSTHMVFREGAFDEFDIFFCAGPHHLKEIRETEKL